MTCVFTSLLDPIRNRPGDPYPEGRQRATSRLALKQRESDTVHVHLMEDDDEPPIRARAPELVAAAAAVVPPPEPVKRRARGTVAPVEYLPLEPGQLRRRRAGPDGKPVPRAPKGSRSGNPRAPGVPVVYKGPVREAGEMSYGAAVRMVEQSNRGELVDMDDLSRACDTIAKAAGAAAC